MQTYVDCSRENSVDVRNKARRQRYAEDPDYRAQVLERNRCYKERRKAEQRVRRAALLTKTSSDSWRLEPGDRFGITVAAKMLGCSVSAIRKWERAGVVPEPEERDSRGHRRYTTELIEEYRSLLEAAGRLQSSRLRPSPVFTPLLRVVLFADGREEQLPLFRIGTVARVVGRTTVALTQLEKKGHLPTTPLRSPTKRRDRLYTLPMIKAIRNAFIDYGGDTGVIKGVMWTAFRDAVSTAWLACGVDGATVIHGEHDDGN